MSVFIKEIEYGKACIGTENLVAIRKGHILVWEAVSKIWKNNQIWKNNEVWKY